MYSRRVERLPLINNGLDETTGRTKDAGANILLLSTAKDTITFLQSVIATVTASYITLFNFGLRLIDLTNGGAMLPMASPANLLS